ncbi:hypothetical protein I4U23_015364 [Adineta vaga]|nr:hypothetical protein I4U23_015364 [Adineta vaga]
MNDLCLNSSLNNPSTADKQVHFTSNYEMEIFTSTCYYLDTNNPWKTDGLRGSAIRSY